MLLAWDTIYVTENFIRHLRAFSCFFCFTYVGYLCGSLRGKKLLDPNPLWPEPTNLSAYQAPICSLLDVLRVMLCVQIASKHQEVLQRHSLAFCYNLTPVNGNIYPYNRLANMSTLLERLIKIPRMVLNAAVREPL
jgi:hypothetical protein